MSSRQTGSRYSSAGGISPTNRGGGGIQAPPAIAALLGIDKMKSGGMTTGSDGRMQFQPYVGKGRQSTINAALLNEQMGGQILGMQHEKEFSKQQSDQAKDEAAFAAKIAEHLANSAQFNAIATKLGIPADQLAGSVSQEITANALKGEKNKGASLDTQQVKDATTQGMVAGLQAPAVDNAAKLTTSAPTGAISQRLPLNGIPGQQLSGATPRQSSVPNVMNFNGKPITVGTKQITDYEPASATPLFPPGSNSLWDAAKGIQEPDGSGQQPSLTTGQQDSPLQTYYNSGMNTNAGAPAPDSSGPGLLNNPQVDQSVQQGDQSSIMDFYRNLMMMMQNAGAGGASMGGGYGAQP